MKIEGVYAKEQYAKISQISRDANISVLDKINALSRLQYNLLFQMTKQTEMATEKSQFKKLDYILLNATLNPGDSFSNEIKSAQSEFTAIFKGLKAPTIDDYKRLSIVVAQFVAFFSNTSVPTDITDVTTSKMMQEPIQQSVQKTMQMIREDDLIDNPTTRVPVVLCLDTSASMSTDSKIEELNKGVKNFFDAIVNDEIAKYSVELSIVTFNYSAEKIIDFANIERQIDAFDKLKLKASGNTAMGQAVNLAIDLLDKRKLEYKDKGVDYWQPWLVLMTDGQPTDDISEASKRVVDLVNDRKLTIFPVGIGAGANMRMLQKFSPKREPLRMNEVMMSEFFDWLGKSVKSVSQSTPGTEVKLPPIGWATV